jgi:D-alanyl-D-alanine carboxypeptidase (penicillin-binding protein 5/6)
VRRTLAAAVLAVLASLLSLGAAPTPTGPAVTGSTVPPPAPPKAWILVDQDTGAVLSAGNERSPMLAASVFKVLTALIGVQRLAPGDEVPVSAVAEGMPARKINMKAGQVWRFEDVLHSLLLVSANDAAVAIAEKVSGSREGFAETMAHTGQRLDLADHPALLDPAGLDDEFSWGGGTLISARDLAIVARAAMSEPRIRDVLVRRTYRFDGGDGNPHRLLNHNPLVTGNFPGAIGVKTGYTKRAGYSLIGAATRDGRTMIAIVLGAPDPTRFTQALLDTGFTIPVSSQRGVDTLPPIVAGAARFEEHVVEPANAKRADAVHVAGVNAARRAGRGVLVPALVAVAGGIPLTLIALRRRAVRRRRRRRRVVTWS